MIFEIIQRGLIAALLQEQMLCLSINLMSLAFWRWHLGFDKKACVIRDWYAHTETVLLYTGVFNKRIIDYSVCANGFFFIFHSFHFKALLRIHNYILMSV